MIKLETRTIMHCKCEKCGYDWDSFRRDKRTKKLISEKPKRCANCKYLSWNGEDRRRKDPYEFAPPETLSIPSGKVPQLRPKDLLEAVLDAQKILGELSPRDASLEEVLGKLSRQIETLGKLTGNGKKVKHAAAQAV